MTQKVLIQIHKQVAKRVGFNKKLYTNQVNLFSTNKDFSFENTLILWKTINRAYLNAKYKANYFYPFEAACLFAIAFKLQNLTYAKLHKLMIYL